MNPGAGFCARRSFTTLLILGLLFVGCNGIAQNRETGASPGVGNGDTVEIINDQSYFSSYIVFAPTNWTGRS
jgi:hypothetical protein